MIWCAQFLSSGIEQQLSSGIAIIKRTNKLWYKILKQSIKPFEKADNEKICNLIW